MNQPELYILGVEFTLDSKWNNEVLGIESV